MNSKRRYSKNHSQVCAVCGRPAKMFLSRGNEIMMLCKECNKHFFFDLRSNETKKDRLIEAKNLCREEGLTKGFALNVIIGRYTLQEAKRRCRLKERERSGKSVDFYALGWRRPGCYR